MMVVYRPSLGLRGGVTGDVTVIHPTPLKVIETVLNLSITFIPKIGQSYGKRVKKQIFIVRKEY